MIIFACVFGGALGGMFIREALPKHHLTNETENAVKLGIGVIATMSALVIGLLLASAKGSFDTRDTELRQFFATLILLDRQLVALRPGDEGGARSVAALYRPQDRRHLAR